MRLDLDPMSNAWKVKDALCHDIRESWRYARFEKWKAQKRIDSEYCRQSRYKPERFKAAMKLYQKGPHHRAVLAGAPISPAHFAQGFERTETPANVRKISRCPWCSCEMADLEHVNWKCKRQVRPEGLRVPMDSLSRRMGWPLQMLDKQSIKQTNWMASVRANVLAARYDHGVR